MNKKLIITLSSLAAVAAGVYLWRQRSQPPGLKVIDHFELRKYLGKWYEIARFDYRFERHLEKVTAEYSLKGDGHVKVVNRGYDIRKRKWKKAIGSARFAGDPHTGHLLVSFFGPFYSSYNILALDDQYQYALVAGKSRDYLWILSRTPGLPDKVKTEYLSIAGHLGFDTSQLIWVNHL